MKTYKYIIVILILLVFNILLLYNNKSLPENYNKASTTYDFILNRLTLQIQYSENLKINKEIIVTDSSGKTFPLKKVFQGNKKLVFRFKEVDCDECVEAELPFLKNIAKSIGSKNIILLASMSGINDLKIFNQTHHLNYPIYDISSELLFNNEIERLSSPYLFLTDETLNTEMIFLPEKTLPNLSKIYYEKISKLWNQERD